MHIGLRSWQLKAKPMYVRFTLRRSLYQLQHNLYFCTPPCLRQPSGVHSLYAPLIDGRQWNLR